MPISTTTATRLRGRKHGAELQIHVSAENPYLAYWEDADGLGQSRFVEACKENGRVYPVRGKSLLDSGNPQPRQKFKTFHAFASAGLSEIYQPEILKRARKLEINELASGLLVNSGKGTFTLRKLPRLAQTSPFWNGRCRFRRGRLGRPGGESKLFPMQPETGRLNGGTGLLLLGDPKVGSGP